MKSIYPLERLRAAVAKYPITISKRVDLYLSAHLPDLIDEYKLATRTDIREVEQKLETYGEDVAELESWREVASKRAADLEKNVERLELKYGVKG
jgi:hypothetical protein